MTPLPQLVALTAGLGGLALLAQGILFLCRSLRFPSSHSFPGVALVMVVEAAALLLASIACAVFVVAYYWP